MDIMNRREFLKAGAGAAAFAAMPSLSAFGAEGLRPDFKWSMLVHFGMKWCGELERTRAKGKPAGYLSGHLTQEEYDLICTETYWTHKKLRFDEGLWREYSGQLKANGCNTLVIDLAEFMRFPSHPELAVADSWSPERTAAEVERLRGMGFELIPKLNFSCTHNGWMGIYRRMIGTPKYYAVCRDVIRDTMRVFKGAKVFHLGMDEEQNIEYQKNDCDVMIMRNNRLWWHDMNFYFDEVRKYGCRPWIWSNSVSAKGFKGIDEYAQNVPKDVISSAWAYYHADYKWNPKVTEEQIRKANAGRLERYRDMVTKLSQAGYSVMPCMSHCYGDPQGCFDLFKATREIVPADRFAGVAMTTWMPVMPAYRRRLMQGAEIIGELRQLAV